MPFFTGKMEFKSHWDLKSQINKWKWGWDLGKIWAVKWQKLVWEMGLVINPLPSLRVKSKQSKTRTMLVFNEEIKMVWVFWSWNILVLREQIHRKHNCCFVQEKNGIKKALFAVWKRKRFLWFLALKNYLCCFPLMLGRGLNKQFHLQCYKTIGSCFQLCSIELWCMNRLLISLHTGTSESKWLSKLYFYLPLFILITRNLEYSHLLFIDVFCFYLLFVAIQ